MSFLILGAMVAAVLAVSLFRYGRNQFADRGVCSAEFKPPRNAALRAALSHNISVESGQLECYFSENYVNARDQFRHLAERAGASMKVMPVVNDLTTDVAIFPGRSDRYVVHISGTHGVEAYSGSAVQAALLEYITENNLYGDVVASAQLPTLVVVHALNPFGFANNRRVNEDNVDLNRNFLSDDEFHFVKSRNPNYANYVDLDSVLNPTSTLTTNFFLNELIAYLQMAQSIAMHGLMRLKRALVSGNYHFAKGLGFGGFSQTQSARNLIKLVVDDLRIPTEAKEIVMVDVHTGLGPSGVDTLMFHVSDEYFAHKQSAEQPLSMDTVFPTDFDSKGKLVGGIKVEEFQSSPLQPKTSTQKDNVHVAAKDVAAGYELTGKKHRHEPSEEECRFILRFTL